jgi:hypothetical protein
LCIEAWLSRWLDHRESASVTDRFAGSLNHQVLRT